jgi:LysR family transcriptional regulator, glycine cleavage system transcriptional activator
MQLPPLAPLRAFEASARHLSFTRAADELSLTQGAISQQIKQLELHLGFPLFVRRTRRLELTEEGVQLAHVVREALTGIGTSIERLRAGQGHGPLTVSVLASFAAQWLMPRLPKFHAAHPDIDLRLHTDDKLANLRTDGVDIAIRLGFGSWAGLDVRLLMRERIFPVCSPQLMNSPNAIRSVQDLATAILLHDDDRRTDETANGWPFFLKKFGVKRADVTSGPGFNQSSLMVQAAIHGQGVALARSSLAEVELDTGRLVRPLDAWLDSPWAVYSVTLPERADQPKIAAFRDWIAAEAKVAAKRYGTL